MEVADRQLALLKFSIEEGTLICTLSARQCPRPGASSTTPTVLFFQKSVGRNAHQRINFEFPGIPAYYSGKGQNRTIPQAARFTAALRQPCTTAYNPVFSASCQGPTGTRQAR